MCSPSPSRAGTTRARAPRRTRRGVDAGRGRRAASRSRIVDAVGAQRFQAALDATVAGERHVLRRERRGRAAGDPHSRDVPLVPASTQKLLTAAAALTTLGPTATLDTRAVAAQAPQDGTRRSAVPRRGRRPAPRTPGRAGRTRRRRRELQGTKHHDDLAALADSIVAAGVKRIPGGIVADDSRYETLRYLPSWKDTYRTDGEVGPLGALTVDGGFSALQAQADARRRPGRVRGPTARDAAGGARRGRREGGDARPGAARARSKIAKISSPPLNDVVGEDLAHQRQPRRRSCSAREIGVPTPRRSRARRPPGPRRSRRSSTELGLPTTNALDASTVRGSTAANRSTRASCSSAPWDSAAQPEFARALERARRRGPVGHARRPARRDTLDREGARRRPARSTASPASSASSTWGGRCGSRSSPTVASPSGVESTCAAQVAAGDRHVPRLAAGRRARAPARRASHPAAGDSPRMTRPLPTRRPPTAPPRPARPCRSSSSSCATWSSPTSSRRRSSRSGSSGATSRSGSPASLLLGLGVVLLGVGGLRALQTETGETFTGDWSWAPVPDRGRRAAARQRDHLEGAQRLAGPEGGSMSQTRSTRPSRVRHRGEAARDPGRRRGRRRRREGCRGRGRASVSCCSPSWSPTCSVGARVASAGPSSRSAASDAVAGLIVRLSKTGLKRGFLEGSRGWLYVGLAASAVRDRAPGPGRAADGRALRARSRGDRRDPHGSRPSDAGRPPREDHAAEPAAGARGRGPDDRRGTARSDSS